MNSTFVNDRTENFYFQDLTGISSKFIFEIWPKLE